MDDDLIKNLMYAAIQEGRKALPDCIPNPPVGCVIVQDGRIAAKGYTNEPGKDHAEAMALRTLPICLRDYSAFVTLEPCSFHGKTPSCAESLADRGIGHVYVAATDPDPRNNGKGVETLRRRGIDVTVGILEHEALADLSPYLIRESSR